MSDKIIDVKKKDDMKVWESHIGSLKDNKINLEPIIENDKENDKENNKENNKENREKILNNNIENLIDYAMNIRKEHLYHRKDIEKI